MGRIILIMLLVGVSYGYGQNLHLSSSTYRNNKSDGIFTYREGLIKVTIKTMINKGEIDNVLERDFDKVDYYCIGMYDIRFKIYLANNLRLVYRVLASDIRLRGCTSFLGLVIKF